MTRRTRVLVLDQAVGLWGAQSYLLRLAQPMADRGFDLILAGSRELSLAEAWKTRGLPHLELPLPLSRSVRVDGDDSRLSARAAGQEALVLRSSAISIRDLVRAEGIDAIHANGHAVHLDAAMAGRMARVPVVLHLHEEMNQSFGKALRFAAVGAATRSVAVSHAVAGGLPKLLQKRTEVIVNGVDVDQFTPSAPDAAVRASLGATGTDVLLVAITRLDPEKRIEDLVEALAPMVTEPGWHLALVGVTSSYPDYAEQMHALAGSRLAGRVTFAGRREDVPAILNAADVLVHTGVVEGMPLGIIEAQACGRPVVAYRVAGVPEAVIEGTTGLLAAPGDTAELGRHIARLICDTGRRDEMGRAARVHARAHHSIDTQADGHADVLARVTTGRTSTSVHPASRPPRVLLANHWHDDNRGDSAITQGILSVLRATAPTSTVTVATLAEPGDLSNGGTRHLERFWPGLRVESSPIATELRGRMGKRSRPRIVVDAALWAARLSPDLFNVLTGKGRSAWSALMAEQDLVILVGGSNIFDDHGVPAVLSLPRLVEVLSPAQAGVRTGVPVVLLGHTLGPFARPLGRRIAGRLLAGVTRVVVRESTSVPVARRIGAVVVEEAPDMAFAITPEHSPKVTRLLSELPVAASRLLVMSARTHPTLGADADARLVGVFAEAARRLVADGILDGVAVVAHTIGPTPVEDDRPISRALVDALAALPVVLVDEDISPAELSAFYGSVGAVVAVRLHAAILALNGGTPTFAVSYLTAKTQGVMTQVGLPDAVADFATVTADAVVAGVTTQLAVPGLRATLEGRAVGRRQELFGRGAVWFAALNPAGPIRAISSEMVEVSS